MAHLVLKTFVAIACGSAAMAAAQGLPTPAMPLAIAEPVPAPPVLDDGGGFTPLQPIPLTYSDAIPLDGCYPAITESSGTWLRRGLWYADLDAVIMARTWDSDGMTLIEEYDSVATQVIANIGAIPFSNTVASQQQHLGESSPGYDAAARLALGRFLFRDQSNRDHTAEFVLFGGPEWTDSLGAEDQLSGTADGLNLPTAQGGPRPGLHVPSRIDNSGPTDLDISASFRSFDQSDTMQVDYASRFHSWEANYNVAQRMRKDRMELQPSGEWIRRASPGFTWDYTAGFRYFDVEERLDWLATDIDTIKATTGQTADDVDGSYLIRASNNLFGLQLGVGLTYESDRWNVTLSTKQGFYINDARATTALTYFDPEEATASTTALNNYTTDLHENGVSYLGTGSIMARYHLRPNLSLRAGWEFMFVTGLALAPNQADFNPAVRQLHLTGDSFYHGVSAGTEYYW